MKKILLFICAATFIFSCTEQTKTTTEKFTDTVIRDTVIKPTKTDTLKAVLPVANDTVIAGRSIGNISLNEKTEDVIRALGQPDSSDAAMGKAMLGWYSKPSMNGADTVVNSIMIFTSTNFGAKDEASRVKHIRITSPFFKTAEQVRCGSSIAFIKIQYPTIKKASASYTDKAGGTVLIYDNIKEGIAFEINEATKCIGITVHEKGQRAWETYISEFGEVKKL